MAKHLFVVFTNPVPGREEEYNDWYSNTHIRDLVSVPGCAAATRYQLSHTQRMEAPHPWQYMAIYEIETDDIQGFLDALNARRGTPDLEMTDTLAPGTSSYFYAPIASAKKAAVAA
jgi:hypothetical protein